MGKSEVFPPHPESLPSSRRGQWNRRDWLVLLGMLISLIIFYRGSYQLPITAFGLILFVPLAMLRPQLALLFVPLTVPFYFIPKGIWDARFGIRPEGIRFPLHEAVLLITFGATGVHWLMLGYRERCATLASMRDRIAVIQSYAHLRSFVVTFGGTMAPLILFVLAGTIGVLVALPEGRGAALRTWRWMIVEPLLFLLLIRFFCSHAPVSLRLSPTSLLAAFVLGGAVVGGIGVLQWAGINVVPVLGQEVGFSDDILVVEGVRRVSSVYGHPNNLGLYMGRVWPIAAVLAYRNPMRTTQLFFAGCAIVAFGGLLVSFSKGALLGATVAVGFLILGPGRAKLPSNLRGYVGIAVFVGMAVIVGMVMLLTIAHGADGALARFNVFGETTSVRLNTWRSALAMMRDHPFVGIGLDQFLLHYPDYIAESLKQTNEQYTSHPHNIILDLWLNTGVIGLVAFGWLLIRFFRGIMQGERSQGARSTHAAYPRWWHRGAGAAMSAALVHGLVDQFYFVPDLAFAFWLLVERSATAIPHPGIYASPPSPSRSGWRSGGRILRSMLYVLLLPPLAASGRAYLPPEPRSATGPAYRSEVVSPPSFGINAHLATRYPDPSTMDVPGAILQELGVSWVREDFHWYRIEPQPGQWDWLFNDAAVRELTYRRINILGVIGGPSPPWATPYAGDDPQLASFYAPDIDAFVVFATAVVERYHPFIKYWEIWNEPDNALFWRPKPDPVAYADLLIRTSAAVRAIDPEARLLIGGLNPYDQQFLRTVLAAGAWESFDIVAIHPYVDPYSPEVARIATAIDRVRVMTKPHESRSPGTFRPIWVTEVGWASGLSDHDRQGLVDASMQANYLVRAMLLLWEAGVERIFWYTLKDDPGNPYGLIEYGQGRADYHKRKPAFFAFKTLNTQLMHAQLLGRQEFATTTTICDFHTLGRWLRPVQPNGTFASSETGLARIAYHFSTTENDYVVFERAEPIPIPGKPHAVGLWVHGDGSGHQLRLWIRDAQNEVVQITLGTVGPAGWQFLSTPLDPPPTETYVIANHANQRIDQPAAIVAIVLDDDPDPCRGRGVIYIDDLTAIDGQEIYDYQLSQQGDQVYPGGEPAKLRIVWSPTPTWVTFHTAGPRVRYVDTMGNEQDMATFGGLFGLMAGAGPSYIWDAPCQEGASGTEGE